MGAIADQVSRLVSMGSQIDSTRRESDDGSHVDVIPFLKWAGGKRWLLPLAGQLRGIAFKKYFEPFLGSGAMFFGIAPKDAVLSDANEELIEAYEALKEDWSAVYKKLIEHDRNHDAGYYYRIREQAPRIPHTRAARFIYLNRTCWNGLYRVNRNGVFNTPIGSKKSALLDSDDFEQIAMRLKMAELNASDFELNVDRASTGDLVFADPPYTVRHQYNGFVKYNEKLFSWDDQERLCAALIRAKGRGASIICTNADHASIRELYGPHFKLIPRLRFSAIAGQGGARGNYAELCISG